MGSAGGLTCIPKRGIYSGMKVKTSVTLSEELLRALSDQVEPRNRSAFIEEASWSHTLSVPGWLIHGHLVDSSHEGDYREDRRRAA